MFSIFGRRRCYAALAKAARRLMASGSDDSFRKAKTFLEQAIEAAEREFGPSIQLCDAYLELVRWRSRNLEFGMPTAILIRKAIRSGLKAMGVPRSHIKSANYLAFVAHFHDRRPNTKPEDDLIVCRWFFRSCLRTRGPDDPVTQDVWKEVEKAKSRVLIDSDSRVVRQLNKWDPHVSILLGDKP